MNVAFNNLRLNQLGIVYAQGSIHMTGVTFSNVNKHPDGRSIVQQDCSDSAAQCDFKYVGGSVELLNNCYEYRDDLYQIGFFTTKTPNSVVIRDVEIKFNLAIKSYKIPQATTASTSYTS
jgi:hypothetical protein